MTEGTLKVQPTGQGPTKFRIKHFPPPFGLGEGRQANEGKGRIGSFPARLAGRVPSSRSNGIGYDKRSLGYVIGSDMGAGHLLRVLGPPQSGAL